MSNYHRLIGGSVEVGETHRHAIEREGEEELGATIDNLRLLDAGETLPLYPAQAARWVARLSRR